MAGVPVLSTPEANFPEIHSSARRHRLQAGPRELARNMRLRERMGQQGRALALNKYTWERIAEGAMQVYTNLLTGRASSG